MSTFKYDLTLAKRMKRVLAIHVHHMTLNRFENLIIIGRPGSGKSEIVDLMRRTPFSQRISSYYVGDFIELDDFVWLNEKFKEDNIWQELGLPRKYSKQVEDGYVITDPDLWDYCIEVFNDTLKRKYLTDPIFYNNQSLFIEFSRGGDKTYLKSLSMLGDNILSKSCILHLDITYEEALVRNELRFKKGQEDSKLHHKVPLEEMEESYQTSDWEEISGGQNRGVITIRDNQIPFVSLKNQPAPDSESELQRRVMSSLHTLFTMKYSGRPWSPTRKAAPIGTFDHLFVFGKPASGKSEFIDFIKKTTVRDRAEMFHVGPIEELDDYKMLAEKFQEDDVWNNLLGKRRYTKLEKSVHVVTDMSLYNFAAHAINKIVLNRYLPNNDFYNENTLFIEFSRGGELGYLDTLKLFDPAVLRKGAMFYVKTSFDECWRRNVARYEEKRKFSVLAHMVPREQMERLYRNDDWDKLTEEREEGFITVNDVRIPFVTMDNETESKDPNILIERYKTSLDKLRKLYDKTL